MRPDYVNAVRNESIAFDGHVAYLLSCQTTSHALERARVLLTDTSSSNSFSDGNRVASRSRIISDQESEVVLTGLNRRFELK